MKKIFLILIIALAFFALSLTGCDNDNNTDTHTHEWGDWIITTFPTETGNGEETRTCTIDKTHIDIRPLTLETFQTYFYGTWVGTWVSGNVIITIDTNSVKYENTSNSQLVVFNNLVWTALVNTSETTKVEYPFGYTLNDPSTVGNLAFLINATKDKLSSHGLADAILIKQGA